MPGAVLYGRFPEKETEVLINESLAGTLAGDSGQPEKCLGQPILFCGLDLTVSGIVSNEGYRGAFRADLYYAFGKDNSPLKMEDKHLFLAYSLLKIIGTKKESYTNRELSLTFGRVGDDGKIKDINENVQDENGAHVDERQSRKDFRKWENTKFISTILKRNRPKNSYGERLWGMVVTSKERLSTRMGRHLNFGAVITLKELHGVNRIESFIKACTLRGYIVNELDIQNRVEIYNSTQEEITFD